MKKLFTLSFLILPLIGFTQATKKVLFIGNDYTNTNFLPEVIEEIADSKGDSLYWEWSCPNGYTLEQHTSNAQTLGWIAAEDWDYVVFQEQGQLPALSTDIFEEEVIPALDDLCDYARSNNECVKPILFLTWAREEGDTDNCDEYPWVCTYGGQQDSLTSRYLQLADANDAWVIPVGEIWRTALEQTGNEIQLYQEDLHHPTQTGTYLAACAFYTAIFEQSAIDGFIPGDVNTLDGILLQQLAADEILDNEDQWHINPVVWADLIFSGDGLFTTITMETAFNVDSVVVDDGVNIQTWLNGDVGAQIFSGDGTYYYVLEIYSPCGNITIVDSVVIDTGGGEGTSENHSRLFVAYPNPANNILNLEGNFNTDFELIVSDAAGRIVMNEKRKPSLTKQTINVSDLAKGNYQIAVLMNGQLCTLNFSRQ